MQKNKYKIIFIDIDGTLVDDEKIISEATKDVLRKLKDSGIYIVLTSGKPYKSIETFATKCFSTPYLIGSNGAIVKDFIDDLEIFSKKLEKDVATQILKCIKENNLYTMITISGNLISDERDYGMLPENRSEIIIVDSVTDYLKETNNPILKFTVISQDKLKLDSFRNDVAKIPNMYVLPTDIIPIAPRFWKPKEGESIPYCVDIMALNVSKMESIKTLCNYLNIDKSQTIGIGDGLNDIDMFEAVGYKIAMGNSVPEIKAMADTITLSNNESGVAVALNKMFF